MNLDELKYKEFHELARDLLLADKKRKRVLDKSYKLSASESRSVLTTDCAKRAIANEWLGKCEDALEKYINDRIVNGVFMLNYNPIVMDKE